ncbi:ACP S-malonyltransferase [Bacillus cereus]|uniref:ACP S-malonyltransferase n=1 Tax=Bacillus cereus TaxID=1396 RepID=UPI00124474C2|nr:ACP S-malonyltransferase [Bacillus cereus]MCU5475454.1 ACP S-malonyltransferase [Bacillus cereus]MCU5614889.1 ACP S-malonyltransferase [Bacillus cereus]
MKKLGFIFPGQSSQYIGMGKNLYDEFKVARETFEEASETLGINLQTLCFDGPIDELTKTANAQPAILTVSVAAYRILMQELKLNPLFLAGHSLGEFSALSCAGVINLADAVKIVRKRGLLMQEAVPLGEGKMLAVVGLNEWDVESVCMKVSTGDSKVVIANYNSSNQIVISGHVNAVEKAKEHLDKMGGKTIPLKVSAPFHSPLMDAASIKFSKELEKYDYGSFQWPVISNVTATPYKDKQFVLPNLTNQMANPVQWQRSIQYMLNKGVDTFIEIGPKTVLKNLMQEFTKKAQVFSFENTANLQGLRMAEVESKPDGLKLITSCIATAVSTQNHNWDNKEYDKGVIVPYKKLEELRNGLIQTKEEPTIEQMQDALDLLKLIFETKFTPLELREERFNQIFRKSNTQEIFSEFNVY